MKFSLRSLLLSLPIFAVGVYALTRPTALLFQIIFTCTLVVFLIGILISKYGQHRSRSFAFGFSVFGIGYLTAAILVGDFQARDRLDPPLLTNLILEKLYFPMAKPNPPPPGMGGGVGTFGLYDPPGHLFRKVGHTVFSWLFAVVGGTLTQIIGVRVDKSQDKRETVG